jgi:RNA-dependent RNA polymerase
MIAIYHIAKKNRFFNIEKEFFKIKPQWLPPMQLSYDYIPRIFLTPYGQYPRPLKPLRANRVLRQSDQFGSAMKHFCRVILRDCDMGSIQNDLIKSWRQKLRNILIVEGLSIGQCKFHFLLFSNSQLRDGSLCFYHQYKQNTVNHIHQWMGEFNHEKSVGTRIARMAQCFTSTTHGINVRLDLIKF